MRRALVLLTVASVVVVAVAHPPTPADDQAEGKVAKIDKVDEVAKVKQDTESKLAAMQAAAKAHGGDGYVNGEVDTSMAKQLSGDEEKLLDATQKVASEAKVDLASMEKQSGALSDMDRAKEDAGILAKVKETLEQERKALSAVEVDLSSKVAAVLLGEGSLPDESASVSAAKKEAALWEQGKALAHELAQEEKDKRASIPKGEQQFHEFVEHLTNQLEHDHAENAEMEKKVDAAGDSVNKWYQDTQGTPQAELGEALQAPGRIKPAASPAALQEDKVEQAIQDKADAAIAAIQAETTKAIEAAQAKADKQEDTAAQAAPAEDTAATAAPVEEKKALYNTKSATKATSSVQDKPAATEDKQATPESSMAENEHAVEHQTSWAPTEKAAEPAAPAKEAAASEAPAKKAAASDEAAASEPEATAEKAAEKPKSAFDRVSSGAKAALSDVQEAAESQVKAEKELLQEAASLDTDDVEPLNA